ncbi:hypothetical protein JCM19241_2702 [Vibrio ishigakensis]|uniref:Uncharacterized protein n=1 Tax=Vibrio ishigakensis TaxID=1481914 RepID=A0A0B8Q8G4_9VIBR|nr:hypothetical protein JCM19241_2702 [Vibrio ishigakensis]
MHGCGWYYIALKNERPIALDMTQTRPRLSTEMRYLLRLGNACIVPLEQHL